MDFHECKNNTDTGPHASAVAAGEQQPEEQYRHVNGAMPAGHAAAPPQNLTYLEAAKICDDTPNCNGFTFESAEATPTTPVKVGGCSCIPVQQLSNEQQCVFSHVHRLRV
jgi:hypothetical protein